MTLIIFDFDGVIADSEILSNSALAEAITRLGYPCTVDTAMDKFMGKRWLDMAVAIEAYIGHPLPEDFNPTLSRTVRQRAGKELRPVAGAEDFIRGLGSQARCIASSSHPDWLASCLDLFGLNEHFGSDLFSSAIHVERGKPHPDLFLYAAEKMGVEPSQTVVIEDSPTGVAAGVAAGMTVIGLLAGQHIRNGHKQRLQEAGAHHLADTYDDVEAILGRLS